MKRRMNGKVGKRFKGRQGVKSAVRINHNLNQSLGINNLIRVENQPDDTRNATASGISNGTLGL